MNFFKSFRAGVKFWYFGSGRLCGEEWGWEWCVEDAYAWTVWWGKIDEVDYHACDFENNDEKEEFALKVKKSKNEWKVMEYIVCWKVTCHVGEMIATIIEPFFFPTTQAHVQHHDFTDVYYFVCRD